MAMDHKPSHGDSVNRRARPRRPIDAGVRLFVLGPGLIPVAERYCQGVDLSPIGLAVATPGVLEPGTMVVVLMPASPVFDVWLACVAHARMTPEGSWVIGLERRPMPAELLSAAWMEVLRSAA